LKKILSDYQHPIEFSCSPFKLPPVSEKKEESSSGNHLEKTYHDSLASNEILVQQIKEDVLNAVSSSNQTKELIPDSSQTEEKKNRLGFFMKWIQKGNSYYQKNKKVILMLFFFVFFFKLILLIVWILI
jgi:hypothetical protein